MSRGKLIVIEGTDASGKDTQTRLLYSRLNQQGYATETMSFPEYRSPTGRIIGQCYLGKQDLQDTLRWEGDLCWFGNANSVSPMVASLYFAADRFDHAGKINEILASGKNLIVDRYVESNMGHQAGKIRDLKQRKIMVKFIEDLEYGLLHLPKPDSVVFLFMPHEVAKILNQTRGPLDSHETNPIHLQNAEQAYLELAERFNWIKIDCTPDRSCTNLRDRHEISREIFERVKPILDE